MANNNKEKKHTFDQQEQYKPRNREERNLAQAIASLKNEHEAADLLRDLLTLSEIEEFANRLEIARLLKKGLSYKKISDKIGVSTTTVTRVAHWLNHGCGGYWKYLTKTRTKS